MVLPFRRKDKNEKVTANDEDEDINALLNAESYEDCLLYTSDAADDP